VPVPVFCCFSVSEKLVRKYSRNWTKINGGPLFHRHVHGVQRGDGEAPEDGHTSLGHGPHARRAEGRYIWAPRLPFDSAPSSIYSSCPENPKDLSHIQRKVSEPPPSSTLAREGSEALPGTLPEGRSSPEGSTSPCLPPE